MTKTNTATKVASAASKTTTLADARAAAAKAAKAAGHPDKVVAAVAKGRKVLTAEDLGGSTTKAKLSSGKPAAQLARGIAAKDAQHSAKAVSDAADKARAAAPKAAGKADKVQAKGKAASDAKSAAPKSKSTAGVVSTRDGDQKITVVAKTSPYKPGSKADETFALFAKAGTVSGFKALVAKNPSKYDAGYIRYSARDGHIKVG